ncbi:Site-specific DNA recombinase [Pasteurella testudinis DSM 23072]|uniref:Site-specific DNA recombinase n=1 Tax=Pasteurella testudinis DSM 23072 TaxID=1122938 RepID=A0A1W1UW54_9PAST|nr:recombinase family protein [Pasteurella testudinis]SMB85266.1 Site-specific DNA recombinase [Pasteurella testudinis DSM 23072]SUB52150.1 Putative transposon Tn552 DNA-invertase bin3 [Pasteurella testudinis]
MKVARVYLRVSTQEQNLVRQDSLLDKIREEGYYLAGVYREKASGANLNRPVLNQLIEDLQPGDVVVAEHIDRLTRLPLAEAEKLFERIKEKGAFLSIPGIVDLSQIATDSEIAKIVLASVQTMLFKVAIQMSRDDYEQRRARQAAGIERAKLNKMYRGKVANHKKHQLIIELRKTHTIKETAMLAGCSPSLVKLVMRSQKNFASECKG